MQEHSRVSDVVPAGVDRLIVSLCAGATPESESPTMLTAAINQIAFLLIVSPHSWFGVDNAVLVSESAVQHLSLSLALSSFSIALDFRSANLTSHDSENLVLEWGAASIGQSGQRTEIEMQFEHNTVIT